MVDFFMQMSVILFCQIAINNLWYEFKSIFMMLYKQALLWIIMVKYRNFMTGFM
jgi:hypothetical protein